MVGTPERVTLSTESGGLGLDRVPFATPLLSKIHPCGPLVHPKKATFRRTDRILEHKRPSCGGKGHLQAPRYPLSGQNLETTVFPLEN